MEANADARVGATSCDGFPSGGVRCIARVQMTSALLLERWPVSIELPVAWGEMDAFQHVNNVAYLRWFESARIAYFEAAGMMARMKETHLGPILARASVDYRRPVTYPDRVTVGCTVASLGTSSFVMKYRVHSHAQAAQVADGDSVVVMVDYRTGKKAALDEPLRAALMALEARGQG